MDGVGEGVVLVGLGRAFKEGVVLSGLGTAWACFAALGTAWSGLLYNHSNPELTQERSGVYMLMITTPSVKKLRERLGHYLSYLN